MDAEHRPYDQAARALHDWAEQKEQEGDVAYVFTHEEAAMVVVDALYDDAGLIVMPRVDMTNINEQTHVWCRACLQGIDTGAQYQHDPDHANTRLIGWHLECRPHGPRAACPECGMGGDVGGTEPNPIPF